MKGFLAIPLLALAAGASALGTGLTDEKLLSWDISTGGSLAGTEKVAPGQSGFASSGGFTYQGIAIQNDYTITFGPSGLMESYKAVVSAAGNSAAFAITVAGQTLTLKITQNGNLIAQKDFPFSSATVLLDNNIASQYRMLARVLDPSSGAKVALQLLVPSVLAQLPVDAVPAAGSWTWKAGSAEGTAVKWDISSAAVPPISVFQDTASRQIVGVDIPSGGAQYRLTGLTLANAAAASPLPPLFDASKVREKSLTVKTGVFSMGATLTYPGTGAGPFPGVLLIAGSGPNDRDETIGPNKPFRDLAVALANKGFAVLRFDKRTFAYKANPAALSVSTMTVKEEFIDDAVSALRLLAAQQNVDGTRLTIVGHSLGAWGLPFVMDGLGADAARVRHLIYLAPAGRDWKPMILHQLRYQASLSPDNEAMKNAVADAEKRFSEFSTSGAMTAQFMNASALYWNDILHRDPVAVASRISVDSLSLRGSLDIQVDDADFRSWQAVLGGVSGREFVTLPGLNHLFMKVDPPSTGAEYFKEGRISTDVIDLISARIGK